MPSQAPDAAGIFAFKPLEADDFPLLHRWLNEPHVLRWWDGQLSLADVTAKYAGGLASKVVQRFIVRYDGRAFGFIQSYLADQVGGGWWPEATAGTLGIDQYIGEPALIGKGLGPAFIRQFTQQLFARGEVHRIITDPSPDNASAIRAYEKAGFTPIGAVETPDGQALLMDLRRP